MLVLVNEIPAVGIPGTSGIVEHKNLAQGLQRKEPVVCVRGRSIRLCPFLRNIGLQNTGIDHFGLDLVAILNQRHCEGSRILE